MCILYTVTLFIRPFPSSSLQLLFSQSPRGHFSLCWLSAPVFNIPYKKKKKRKVKKVGSFPPAPAMLVLVQFLLQQVGSLQCWRRSAMQARKQLGGMPNGFSIPPCGSTRGQRRDLGCGRRQLQPYGLLRSGIGGQMEVAQPATNQCAFCRYRGLEGGVGQLLGFWYWSGTGIFLALFARELQREFARECALDIVLQNLIHVPYLPQLRTQGKLLGHFFQFRLTLQKYWQELSHLTNPVSLLAG